MKKKLFLKFAKFRNSRNSQNSVWKPNFFPRQNIPKKLFCFTLSLRWWYTILSLVCLNNSLTRWKRTSFKIPFSRTSKVPYGIPTFFLCKSYQKFFLLYAFITLVILHTKFGLILTTPWPGEKELFSKFAKIRNLRNSQNFVWKPNFFPRQAKLYQFVFCFSLSLHWWYTISSLVCLNNSLTRWKRTSFKIPFSRTSKVPYGIPTFFLGKSYQKFFLLYAFITLVILHTKLGLILTTPWPGEKELFLKFAKIRNLRNSQNFVWKPNFFPRQAKLYQFIFCFSLSLHSWYSIPSVVWFEQLLDPMKKTYF